MTTREFIDDGIEVMFMFFVQFRSSITQNSQFIDKNLLELSVYLSS